MLRVILVIVVYVIAPAFIITWVIKRYRSGVKLNATEMLALVLSIVLVGVIMFAYSGRVTDRDSVELEQIVSTLITKYDFPVKSRYQDKPAVDGVVHAKYLELRIYGVEDSQQQAQINLVIKKLRRQVASKPIVVNYYLEEVWQENSDGSRRPLRDQERLLNKEKFE